MISLIIRISQPLKMRIGALMPKFMSMFKSCLKKPPNQTVLDARVEVILSDERRYNNLFIDDLFLECNKLLDDLKINDSSLPWHTPEQMYKYDMSKEILNVLYKRLNDYQLNAKHHYPALEGSLKALDARISAYSHECRISHIIGMIEVLRIVQETARKDFHLQTNTEISTKKVIL